MIRFEALKELAAKVQAGGTEGKFDPKFERAFYQVSKTMATVYWASDAYHGSLDAAKALHEAVLPGWTVWYQTFVGISVKPMGAKIWQEPVPFTYIPARAWLLSILRALIAMDEAK